MFILKYFHYNIQRCFVILKFTPFMNPLVNELIFKMKIRTKKKILQLFCKPIRSEFILYRVINYFVKIFNNCSRISNRMRLG